MDLVAITAQAGTAAVLVWVIGFLCILLAAIMLDKVDVLSIIWWSFELAFALFLLWILVQILEYDLKGLIHAWSS